MPDPPGPPREPTRPRPGGNPAPRPPHGGLPEPPAYRAHPLAVAAGCVNCGHSVRTGHAVPRCWECSRALCDDCYWRHGLGPADHRCAACSGRARPRASPSEGISGGRPAPGRPVSAGPTTPSP